MAAMDAAFRRRSSLFTHNRAVILFLNCQLVLD